MLIKMMQLCIFCFFVPFIYSCGGVGGGSEKAVFQYDVKTIEGEDGVELRLYYGDNHFLTLKNMNGVLEIIPHPGADQTDSGTVWVAQPYMQGAILGHTTTTTPLVYTDVINIKTMGHVSKAADQSVGLWSMELDFVYNPERHEISATGQLGISVSNPLDSNKMYLFKLNSQYLNTVALLPLKHQSPAQTIMGDTGWMEKLIARTSNQSRTWIPDQQAALTTDYLEGDLILNIIGDYYHPDTAAYGLAPMAPSYKAGMLLTIQPDIENIELAYECTYDTDKQQEISSPNILIAPFVRSLSSQTNFKFNIDFSARSIDQQDGSTLENAGQSCNTMLHNNLSEGDGLYWVDIDENPLTPPDQVYCDMSGNDGGWMLYASINQPQDVETITADNYSKGLLSPDGSNINSGNWILPAYMFNRYITVMRLNMGDVTDFFIPASSCSFENMLVSNKCHLWASTSSGPFEKPDYTSTGLGGSAHNWPLYTIDGDNRFTLSFWGSNNDGGSGGCCSLSYSSEYNWGRSFKLWVR
ncbi:MAG: hypothetical protein HQK75_04060 [Candidatus Magnetomorum sp.]|nr:hypothetical protein [Candidatus Magnetomorum sp.]